MNQRKVITVFEHQAIKLNQVIDKIEFDERTLLALQKYYGEEGIPYFSLIHNGIRFNEYVGVIQVGNTLIEILPKADKNANSLEDKSKWRNILIKMMLASGIFEIHAPSSSALRIKNNNILDLYFTLFINEVEYLLHNGLVKRYRNKTGNVTALKGSLQFSKHIQHNLTHQERFYVRYTTFDSEHTLHKILYKTILLLKQINTNGFLHSRIGALLLNFPEMPDIKIAENIFANIIFNRKTEPYKKAIEIARLLLLQYHPDVQEGKNNVLALMFDMNKLWEKFIYATLRKHKNYSATVIAQNSKYFWQSESGKRSSIKPDIIINKDQENCVVLDTKWKNLNGFNPSPEDLRQMYVYHEYFKAERTALVYPGYDKINNGTFELSKKQCSVISINVEPDIQQWQLNIYNCIDRWMNPPMKESA
jgi:5-methylcytosine-specific restriction enzyme subunit McrC